MMEEIKHENSGYADSKVDIAIGKFPPQGCATNLYDLSEALKVGTIFKDLHKPFFMGGDGNAR